MSSDGKNLDKKEAVCPKERGLVDDISRDFPHLFTTPDYTARLHRLTNPDLRIRTDWFSDDRILPRVAIGG